MSQSIEIVSTVILCLVLTLLAYWRKIFDFSGSVAAFSVGVIIGIFGSTIWLLVLLVFLISSFLATKFEFEYKKEIHAQEGVKGERKVRNVLANGMIPVMIAVMKFSFISSGNFAAFLFLTAISAAAADTLASEIGVLSENAYMITNLKKKVPPGTNGGVSLLGTSAAFFASFYVALIGCLLMSLFDFRLLFIITALGFLSCNIDSLLGATLEQKGHLTKGMVNYISIATSTLFGVLIWIKFLL